MAPFEKLSRELITKIVDQLCYNSDIVLPRTRRNAHSPQIILSQISHLWRRVVHSTTSLFSCYEISLSPNITAEMGQMLVDQTAHYTRIWRASKGIVLNDLGDGLRFYFALTGPNRHYRDFADSESYVAAVNMIWTVLETHGVDMEALAFLLTEQAIVHLGSRGKLALYHLEELEIRMFIGQPKDDDSIGWAGIEEGDDEDDHPEAPAARFMLHPSDEDSELFETMGALTKLTFGFQEEPRRVLELIQWAIPYFQLTTLALPNVWLPFYDCVKVLREAIPLEHCRLACVTPILSDGIITEYWDAKQRDPAPLDNLEDIEITFQTTLHSHLFAHFTSSSLSRMRLSTLPRPEADWKKEPEMPWLQHNFPDWIESCPNLTTLEVYFEFGNDPESDERDNIAIRHDVDALQQMLAAAANANSAIVELDLFWRPLQASAESKFGELFELITKSDHPTHINVDATIRSVRMLKTRLEAEGLMQMEDMALYTPKRQDCSESEYEALQQEIRVLKTALRGKNIPLKVAEVGDPNDDGQPKGWKTIDIEEEDEQGEGEGQEK